MEVGWLRRVLESTLGIGSPSVLSRIVKVMYEEMGRKRACEILHLCPLKTRITFSTTRNSVTVSYFGGDLVP